MARLHIRNLLRSPLGYNVPASVSARRTEVDDPAGCLDDIQRCCAAYEGVAGNVPHNPAEVNSEAAPVP
jgi:hypothetical protein